MRIFNLIEKMQARYYGGKKMIEYLRKQGMCIGEECRIFCDISTSESYLVKIGNNVTISNNVQFITHDASIQKGDRNYTDIFGKIIVGDNSFIGARSILMYGVELGENTIVAAGSVVTKSFKENGKIIGGNPAKIIGDVEDFVNKNKQYCVNIRGMNSKEKKKLLQNERILVRR